MISRRNYHIDGVRVGHCICGVTWRILPGVLLRMKWRDAGGLSVASCAGLRWRTWWLNLRITKTKTWKDNSEVHIYATMRSCRGVWKTCLCNRPMQTQSHVCASPSTMQTTQTHRVTSQTARWSAAVSSLVIHMANHATASTSTIRCAHVEPFPITTSNQTMLPICHVPIKPHRSCCCEIMPRFPRQAKQCARLENKPNMMARRV
jgi:hypothetical protein